MRLELLLLLLAPFVAADCTAHGDTVKCNGRASFALAKRFCEDYGLRLCTAGEIRNGAAVGTGCGYDKKFLWTASACPDGHLVSRGRQRALSDDVWCARDASRKYSGRCCSGEPCDAPPPPPLMQSRPAPHGWSFPSKSNLGPPADASGAHATILMVAGFLLLAALVVFVYVGVRYLRQQPDDVIADGVVVVKHPPDGDNDREPGDPVLD
jgi:hypothetical protein